MEVTVAVEVEGNICLLSVEAPVKVPLFVYDWSHKAT